MEGAALGTNSAAKRSSTGVSPVPGVSRVSRPATRMWSPFYSWERKQVIRLAEGRACPAEESKAEPSRKLEEP
jgi:hypothetical protein